MEQKHMYGYAAVLIVGLAVGFLFGSGTQESPYFGRGWGMMGDRFQKNGDRIFIEQMIPHHEGAIEMAQLALTKAKTEEVKSLAQGIIEAQQREIDEMKKWYRAWYGTDVPVVGPGGGMMMGHGMHMDTFSGDLSVLSQAQNFDLEFVNQMIPHHEMAVMMTRMMLSETQRPELKTLADQIVTSQTREINMMRSWKRLWESAP